MSHTWEIMPGKLPAKLWQADVIGAFSHDADLVITCTALTKVLPPRAVHVVFDFKDEDRLPDMDAAADIAALAIDFMHRKKDVLVACNAGINRSGLIVGMILRMMGYQDVVEKIRETHPEALANKTFRDYFSNL